MAEETKNFSKQHKLDDILQDLFRRAFNANTKYPLIFVADEIYKMSGSEPKNQKLADIRKELSRFQALYTHLKQRESGASPGTNNNDEKSFQEYYTKHDLRRHRMELVAFSYMAESENPLMFIANYIHKQPDTNIIIEREIKDVEKRNNIYKGLIQDLMIKSGPMSIKELEEFSTNTVKKEHEKYSQ